MTGAFLRDRRVAVTAAAAVTAAVALAAAACGGGGDGGDDPGAAGDAQVCAAAEQTMTTHGDDLQAALTGWDGTPENVGDITGAAEDWGQAIREQAGDAEDGELRAMLEDLATAIDEFGESWEDPEADPDLTGIETALEPLDDRCGFGDEAQLATGGSDNTTQVCADALEEAGSGSFEDVSTAAYRVNDAVERGDQAALDDAVAELRTASSGFAQGFRDIAEEADDPELASALTGIATSVEEWSESFEQGEPADLSGFEEAVATLGAVCD